MSAGLGRLEIDDTCVCVCARETEIDGRGSQSVTFSSSWVDNSNKMAV